MKKKYNTVLIVDDDPNQVNLIKIYLKQANLDIITAKNGRHALSILKDKSFDLVLTDYQMPEMDGETMISKIRNELKLSIPVVMISANDTQKNLSKFKNVKLLRKPFTPDQIKNIFK
ncbi:MAG: response regulator [Calditrichia bacterium]|nr:response regulator [Calditrichia bacterium]